MPDSTPPAGPPRSWWHGEQAAADTRAIAYFSAEFALHQSLPIYAGGLGVLAGDHCKEASDLGLPLVGIGFMYPQGYFHQRVTNDGWQQEHYERINWADAPIETAITPDGKPCITAVPLGDRTVLAAVWRVRVGHVKLYLLDTDLDENAPWDRELSARLYGGDRETRIQQEVILGIGGVRVLRAMGIEPAVWHLNEGHAAFVVLQRIRELIEHGSSFDDALEQVRQTTVFTTHTPVPAGHDAFPFHLVEKHLAGSWGELGQHRARFLALGEYDNGHGAQFNMTALALRTAGGVNAVSELHGHVTREMWQPMWPDRPVDGVPVQAITNGVHVPTWIAGDLRALLEAHLGADWVSHVDDPGLWQRFDAIPAQPAQAEEAVVGRRRDAHVGPQPMQRRGASPRCRRSRRAARRECPPMYLVAACTETSTPWSNARKPSGVAHVLSSTTRAPCACATAAIAGTSCTSNVSEPGDSANTTRVFGGIARSMRGAGERIVVTRRRRRSAAACSSQKRRVGP